MIVGHKIHRAVSNTKGEYFCLLKSQTLGNFTKYFQTNLSYDYLIYNSWHTHGVKNNQQCFGYCFCSDFVFQFWVKIKYLNILAHLSLWAFLVKICPLSVIVVVVGDVVKFSIFHLLLQNHWANFNQTLHNASLGGLFKWRTPSFSRGDNNKIWKINWRILKIFFSRIAGLIPAKLGTMHPWVKGI